ncbi:hypothetical protein ACKVWC_008059 [Pyricularia oryzae]
MNCTRNSGRDSWNGVLRTGQDASRCGFGYEPSSLAEQTFNRRVTTSTLSHGMLSQRTVAAIGFLVAVNIVVLTFALNSGFISRPASVFSFGSNHPQASSNLESESKSHGTHPPGLVGQQPAKLEEWRLDTDQYILDRSWDLTAPPTTRTYDLVITRGKAWPDGVVRDVLLVNGKFPGPLIEANKGDTVVVNVTNKLDSEPTAIHWHGIQQKETPYYDGTVGVSQCGIPPGQSLVYNFTLEGQFGTFWWHAHHEGQAMDGVLGPLVIHAPEEKQVRQTYDEDRIVILQDWYHDPSQVNLARYLAPGVENDEPIPDNGLINGRNYFNCSSYGTESNRTCHDGTSHAILSLNRNSKTRLRLINGGGFASFEFGIDKHLLNIIEADGILTRPTSVRRVPIHVGQRYSVVVDTNQGTESNNYWIRSRMISHCFKGEENPVLDSTTKAVLHYQGKDQGIIPTAASKDWEDAMAVMCEDPAKGVLVPLISQPPPPATKIVAVDFHFNIGAYQMTYAKINETVTWMPLKNSTTLLEAVDGLRSPKASGWSETGRIGLFPEDQYVIGVSNSNTTEVVDLLVYSLDDGSHPFHLHGHDFWIMATGDSGFDWNKYNSEIMSSTGDSLANVTKRDTLTIKPYAWALIRFVADNPGLWAFHCHMSWHMEAGLMMQFMSGAKGLEKLHIPDDVANLCTAPHPG